MFAFVQCNVGAYTYVTMGSGFRCRFCRLSGSSKFEHWSKSFTNILVAFYDLQKYIVRCTPINQKVLQIFAVKPTNIFWLKERLSWTHFLCICSQYFLLFINTENIRKMMSRRRKCKVPFKHIISRIKAYIVDWWDHQAFHY